MTEFITVQGAREHNLKNVSCELPRNKMILITGPSGSGKSSLAFDTIFAEGQRRYVESLSAYARQFLGMMEKPDVDQITGLSPAISIEQKTGSRNPRSTVGTITEIYDYLRLLFARTGQPYDPETGEALTKLSLDQMLELVLERYEGQKVTLLSLQLEGKKGQHLKLLSGLGSQGFTRVMVDGELYRLDEEIELDRYKKHTISLVVDRLEVQAKNRSRIFEGLELCLRLSPLGLVLIQPVSKPKEILRLSERWSLSDGSTFPELEPRLFSFNSPFGACPTCNGLGFEPTFSESQIIPDERKTLKEGCLEPLGTGKAKYQRRMPFWLGIKKLTKAKVLSPDIPWKDYDKETQSLILHGSDEYGTTGAIPYLTYLYQNTTSDNYRAVLSRYMVDKVCHVCDGSRLSAPARNVFLEGQSIVDLVTRSIQGCYRWFQETHFDPQTEAIGAQILRELRSRLSFLVEVGLGYLTLGRTATTLSGGEAQRIRLATQIGSGLTGVLYILDEPSIGLHQRDNERLIQTLIRLRDLGNTVLVVEHDADMIRRSDWIVDVGPFAGKHGGEIVFSGSRDVFFQEADTLTSRYLTGAERIPIPTQRRTSKGELELFGAKANNLKSIDVAFAIGCLNLVTGVSGSGKSSLLHHILLPHLIDNYQSGTAQVQASLDRIEGKEQIDKVIVIDQAPIGRTPRSNPATYTKVFDAIRSLFTQTAEAKKRGYKPGRFSFNVKGGRCEACQGQGQLKIEMHFLPDVYVECEVCHGTRYNSETLQVLYKGKSIADVLTMTVSEALDFFEHQRKVLRYLETLEDVGLGYIQLGQAATTLSGGEAQRIKLASELTKVATGGTLYILDEPTTGLHFHDVKKLLEIIQRLVAQGNTVIVIEHNLDVISAADRIIDLGPEGGAGGGEVVAIGTPEELIKISDSYTGIYLKQHFDQLASLSCSS